MQRDYNLMLMEGLEFSEEELTANRDGYLTKRQRILLDQERGLWRRLNRLIWVLTPIIIAVIILDGYRIADTPSSRIGFVCFALILAGVSLTYTYLRGKSFDQDLWKGSVEGIEGLARLESYRARDGMKYFVSFEKQRFKISRSAFEAFVSQQKYRIYYVPHSRKIVSAEWVIDS